VVGAVLLLGASGFGATAYSLAERYENNIEREDFLAGLPPREREPGSDVRGPLNILLLGTDVRRATRGGPAETNERSDTIMLIHLPAGLDRAYVIGIPRDAYVPIPPVGRWKGGNDKINAAFDYGGPAHVALTVQRLTGLPIDHVVQVDFWGVVDITNAVGGVDIVVPQTVRSAHTGRVFLAGKRHLNGHEALDYIRQRKQFKTGDLQRMDNQQAFLRALLQKATSSGQLRNPVALNRLLEVATRSLTVDKSMQVKELAFALRGLRPDALTFLTVPVAGDGFRRGSGSVVLLDMARLAALSKAIRTGTIAAFLAAPPSPAPSKPAPTRPAGS